MDKLEKAVEKARQQRDLAMEQTIVRPVALGRLSPTVHLYPPPVGQLDETILSRHRILAHKSHSEAADIYRQLRTHVLQIMNQRDHQSIAITSPRYGDGKTTTAINLAISIALDIKQTALLVDLDLRKPNVHEYLGLKVESGLTNYLIQGTPLKSCLIRTAFERLTVLPAGDKLNNSSETLGSPKMITLVKEIRERYQDRIIIYDMPPLLEQDDAMSFIPYAESVLCVERNIFTRAQDLKQTLSLLSKPQLLGTVLNTINT